MDETTVTECVARYLASHRWAIHSVHCPGAQGGVRLRPVSGQVSRSRETIVPDIVASKRNTFLIVESKPRFDLRDARKAQRATQPGYVATLVKVLELRAPPKLVLPAVAFSGRPPASVVLPAGLVLFMVGKGGRVQVVGTSEDPASAAHALAEYRSWANSRSGSP